MHGSSLILKQDVRDRVWSTTERRAAVVAGFRRSGLSGYQFARLAGMKYPTLMAWVKRAGGSAPVVRNDIVKAGPVLVGAVWGGALPALRETAPLVVHLGCGMRLELNDAGQVALAVQLIQALQPQPQPPC